MFPPRKYIIPNQDLKTWRQKKYQCHPSDLPPFLPGPKSLRNVENDDNHETIDTSHTDKDDTSHTNQDDSIENVKDMKIPMMTTNTKSMLFNIKMVMRVLIILKLQKLHWIKVLSTQPNKKKH